MSSSIKEGSVVQSKLLLHIAENGQSFELDCDETTTVEAVMRFVESVSGIKFNDQLVLSFEARLEPQEALSAYKLSSVDGGIFIFNKVRLHPTSPNPPPEQIDVTEDADPPLPASTHDHNPLDDDPDPALKALPFYERQFRYHYEKGLAIHSRIQGKYESCEKVVRELKVQEKALNVARDNLNRNLDKLRSVKLHPSLQTATHNCLADFVKEENLKMVVGNCNNSHRMLEKKVSDFKLIFGDIKRKVEDLFGSRPAVSAKNLEATIKDQQHCIDEQKSIILSLRKDVETVKKIMDDCVSSKSPSALRPHDAVSALGPMYDVHDKSHLPTMQNCDHLISKVHEFCKDKKNGMNIFLHNYLQKVTYISYIIKDVKFQLSAFKEAMIRQEENFMDLKLVSGVGPAYRACLAEVVRRKASMKLYMGMAGQLAEKLTTRRESEIRRRDEFLKAHGLYIPRDILAAMGLYDTPNQCDVNISPFDTSLLDIDILDLDLYAPERLVGPLLKSEKHGSSKGLLALSSGSSHATEEDEIAADIPKNYELEEQLDGCELLEIAGTSKMEVENAKLKADLASSIVRICFLCPETEYELFHDSKFDSLLKDAEEKTTEALRLKDEYGQYLQSMLKKKQLQCSSHVKRIQELEQRLSDQYLPGKKHSVTNVDDCKPAISGSGEVYMPYLSASEPMDEVSCISNPLDEKLGIFTRPTNNGRDCENILDSSVITNTQLNSSMMEPLRGELLSDKDVNDRTIGQLAMSLAHSSTGESMHDPLNVSPSAAVETKVSGDLLLELRIALAEKSNQLSETEAKLKAVLEEVSLLTKELELTVKFLDESQLNSAHLENLLHEAREKAQTHLCAADRRALEYTALRASVVKISGLFERLKTCVNTKGGNVAFNESLCALAQSLAR